MNKNLARRFNDIVYKNMNKYFSQFRPKVQRSIRQAKAGYERNISKYEQDDFGWIKDTLNEIYYEAEEGDGYFYDNVRIQRGCLKIAKLLDERKIDKETYKGLISSFREDEAEKYLVVMG